MLKLKWLILVKIKQFDLSYFLSDEILEQLLDEMMDICANYQYCKIGG